MLKTILILICSIHSVIANAQKDSIYIYEAVDERPYILECEEETNKYACTDMQMVTFIYSNLEYPTLHPENIEGLSSIVVISYIINAEGNMIDIEIIRDISPDIGLGKEAKRVIELMGEEMNWVAGKQNGQAVDVRFHIPIRFEWN